MKVRVWSAIIVAMLLIAAVGAFVPSQAEDRTSERLDNLETRVSALETQVAGPQLDIPDSAALQLPDSAKTYTLTGTVAVPTRAIGPLGSECRAVTPYDAYYLIGSPVTIEDGDGKLLAKGELRAGELDTKSRCSFPFRISGIPRSDFYELQVGPKRLTGGLVFSFEDLEKAHWTVHLAS